MNGTFHNTFYCHKDRKLHAGDVVRMNGWSAFADCVILGFDDDGKAKVARPYAYVSLAGTTCAQPMLWAETFELPVASILDHYQVIDNDGQFRQK